MKKLIVIAVLIISLLLCSCHAGNTFVDDASKDEFSTRQNSIWMFEKFQDSGDQLVNTILQEEETVFKEKKVYVFIGDASSGNIKKFKEYGDEVLVITEGTIDGELSSEAIKNEVENNQRIRSLLLEIESLDFIYFISCFYPDGISFSNKRTYDEYVYVINHSDSYANYGYELADNWRLREYDDYPRE